MKTIEMAKTNTMPSGDRERIEWIDMLRVVATLLVIVGHSMYINLMTPYGGTDYPMPQEISSAHAGLRLLCGWIYTFHMPLFMAMSGACFYLGFGKVRSLRQLAVGKARRLLLPFLVATTFVAIPVKYFSGFFDTSSHVAANIVIGQYLLPVSTHLWFLPALFLCFMLFMLVEPLHRKLPYVFWPVLFLASVYAGKYVGSIYDVFCAVKAVKYLFYFAVGFYSMGWLRTLRPKWYIVLPSMAAQCLVAVYQPLSGGGVRRGACVVGQSEYDYGLHVARPLCPVGQK